MSENRPPETQRPANQGPTPQQPPQPLQVPPQLLAQAVAAQLMGGGMPRAGFPFGPVFPMPGQLPIPIAQQTVQLWQGQYPPPEAIEHYERVSPGAFNRMIKMAEELQAAQIAESTRAHGYAHSDSRRGHWLGFLTAIGAMLSALASLWFGYPVVAGAFISVPVMGVAKALIESAKTPSPSNLIAAANRVADASRAPAGTPAAPPQTG
jgi:uncharacterized membrane protein